MSKAPAPDAGPAMCPGIAVKGGGGGSGGSGGDGDGSGAGAGGKGKGKGKGASGKKKKGGTGCGDPVCPITGRMFLNIFDFGLGGVQPVRFLRHYSSQAAGRDGEFGRGWSHAYGWRLRVRRREIEVIDDEGREHGFDPIRRGKRSTKSSLGWELSRAGAEYVLRRPDEDEVLRFAAPPGDLAVHYLVSVTDQHGNRTTVERDAHGRLESITDSVGRPIRFTTNDEGRVLTAHVPTEETHTSWLQLAAYTYSTDGDLTSFTDAEGFVWRYRYDRHLMVEHATAVGLSYFYRYDGRQPKARCVESWGEYPGAIDPALDNPPPPPPAAGPDRRAVKGIHHVRLTYNTEFYFTEVRDGIGGLSRYYGDSEGRAVKIINEVGGVSEREFDADTGNPLAESEPTGIAREIQQRSDGTPVGFSKNGVPHVVTEWTDDGQEVQTDLIGGGVTTTAYDAQGNRTFVRHPDDTVEEWHYDRRGCLERSISRQGATTQFEHDGLGRCVRILYPDGGVEEREYDYLSRMTAVTDPHGDRTEWVWDRRSEAVQKTLPDGVIVRAEYDAQRNIVRLDEGPQTTRIAYGGIGWIAKITYPGGEELVYRYDVMGNLTRVVNGRGQEFVIERDHAAQVVAFTTFEGVRTVIGRDVVGDEAYFDTVLGRFAIERDEEQRVTSVETPDQTIQFTAGKTGELEVVDNGVIRLHTTHDALGRVLTDRQGPYQSRVSWHGGEVASIHTDIGMPVEFDFDTSGELAAIRVGPGAIRTEAPSGQDCITRLGDGLLLRETYGKHGSVTRQALTRVDPSIAREAIGTHDDPHVLLWREYDYDGQRVPRRERRSDGTTVVNAVDAAGRATSRQVYDSNNTLETEERFGYDAAGSARIAGARYDALGRPSALHNETFAYDAVGRLVSRQTDAGEWRYHWNSLDQLTRVDAPEHTVELEHDAYGRRMRKRVLRMNELVSSTFYMWANDIVIHELDELNGTTRTYLRPNDEWLVHGHVDVSAGATEETYYLTNPVGAVDCAVDRNGNVVWDAKQTMYGHALPTVEKVSVTARFPNQFDDADVGLVYNRKRWYDPRLGVYVSPDPELLDGTLNPRDYTANPLVFIDPLGLADHGPSKNKPHHKAKGTKPKTKDDMDADYMSKPGAWATPGTKGTPGYANCPKGAVNKGSGFGKAQKVIDKAGKTYGCHGCGAKKSGHPTKGDNHFVCDHQPPRSTYSKRNSKTNNKKASSSNVRLYPHCYNCSQLQAGRLGNASKKDKARLGQEGFARNS